MPKTAEIVAGRPNPVRTTGVAGELAVRAAGLTKLYRHPWTLRVTRGVEDLDLEVRRGEVMGYLGRNGAGKTTTLKLLTGLHKPTRGGAWIFGESVETVTSRQRLGFLPEQPYFYDYLTGRETLEFAARLNGLGAAEARTSARHWLGRVGIADAENRRVRRYSKGMLQRLGLAAALIHEPDLLILDEPMSGLDPLGRRDVRDLLLEQRARGVTVLFSSHILPDVETLCDRVAIVHAGRLVRVEHVGEMSGLRSQRVEIRCEGGVLPAAPPALAPALTRIEHPGEATLVLEDGDRLGEALGWLLGAGVRIRAVSPQRVSLEEIYVETTREAADESSAGRRSA